METYIQFNKHSIQYEIKIDQESPIIRKQYAHALKLDNIEINKFNFHK
jgi:hypothetical protein